MTSFKKHVEICMEEAILFQNQHCDALLVSTNECGNVGHLALLHESQYHDIYN